MIISWVEVGWVLELSVVVLGVEGGSGVVSDDDEVVDGLSVGDVLVEVILEVLNHVHVLLNEVISSDLLEWESVVIELPGVDLWVWVFALLLKFVVDGDGGVVMSLLEVSGEVVHLDVHLVDRDLFTTWGWDEGVWVWVVAVVDWEWNSLGGGGDGDEDGEFHLNYVKFIIKLYNLASCF